MPHQSYPTGDDATSANLSALLQINSFLNNTLDLRNIAPQSTASSNSIDSLWSNLVAGNDVGHKNQTIPRSKAHSVGSGAGVDVCHLRQLLNGSGHYYANGEHCTTPAAASCVAQGLSCNSAGPLSSTNGAVFNYNSLPQQFPKHAPESMRSKVEYSSGSSNSSCGGHSPPSMGGSGASVNSPGAGSSQFHYSSPSGQRGRLSVVSEPGSPSLDDAILMGIQNHRQQQQQQQEKLDSSEKYTDINLNNLLESLNLSSTSASSGRAPLNGSIAGQSLSLGPSNTSLSSNPQLSSSMSNYSLGQDLSQLTQFQNSLSSSAGWGRRALDPQTPYTSLSYARGGYHNGLSASGNSSGNSSGIMSGMSGTGPSSSPSPNTLDILSSLERSSLSSFLSGQDPYSIEKAAKMHRTAAAVCEATCTWSGQLPVRVHKNPFYSCKVFLGGVPWDVTEAALRQTFAHFGNIQVEWPGKENSANPPKGYVYILFDNEKQVKSLLSSCSQDFSNGGNYYFKISSRRMRQKEVQVIPWVMSDSNYVRCPSYQLDPHKTVFIGALHGMLSAEALANIINDLFGGVVYAGIDTDKHKYPIGSGRITFNNLQSYRKAVRAAFVEIKTPKFTKKVQIDPYLADSLCQMCGMQQGPYFCRDETCFKYFCRTCWLVTPHHQTPSAGCHKPLMRNSKLRTQTRLNMLV
ncbi:cytoplasmic polyadenylation element-binding protein 1 isoform X2 [Hyalella azteca]|uniref:Cytoplasmic polyadenylation element-binding protein 1 isoform X2 n=1 Tax=Hyalella azteca TaxID=294128 RepID=A0A979FNK9_HYAAZ|nr:cytoplasmic polyadenylation element-binding protein 1 isoform X2 [Hyalella azteca]